MSFFHKIKRAVTDPKAVITYIQKRGWRHKEYSWEIGSDGIRRKKYRNYEDYVTHQKSKLEKIAHTWLPEQDARFYEALKERLAQDDQLKSGMSVLCLAARTGVEVRAFLDIGFFAIGIDLNPGKENKYVVTGDFHNLQFPDRLVDVVFTNSLDHALDLSKVASEVKRVLKPGGFLILEAMMGEEAGVLPRYFEAMSWKNVDSLLRIFFDAGFREIKRSNFDFPWKGQHVVLSVST